MMISDAFGAWRWCRRGLIGRKVPTMSDDNLEETARHISELIPLLASMDPHKMEDRRWGGDQANHAIIGKLSFLTHLACERLLPSVGRLGKCNSG
jgi:hypothetical protein